MGSQSSWKSRTYSCESLLLLFPLAILRILAFSQFSSLHHVYKYMQVGCTIMSSVEALKAGLRGKALRITHYYRDFLW